MHKPEKELGSFHMPYQKTHSRGLLKGQVQNAQAVNQAVQTESRHCTLSSSSLASSGSGTSSAWMTGGSQRNILHSRDLLKRQVQNAQAVDQAVQTESRDCTLSSISLASSGSGTS